MSSFGSERGVLCPFSREKGTVGPFNGMLFSSLCSNPNSHTAALQKYLAVPEMRFHWKIMHNSISNVVFMLTSAIPFNPQFCESSIQYQPSWSFFCITNHGVVICWSGKYFQIRVFWICFRETDSVPFKEIVQSTSYEMFLIELSLVRKTLAHHGNVWTTQHLLGWCVASQFNLWDYKEEWTSCAEKNGREREVWERELWEEKKEME